jgi:peptide/nickel transport system permease protein
MPSALIFLLRRLAQLVPVIVAIAALNFVLLSLAPGDAAEILAASSGGASTEYVDELRHAMGTDRPWIAQFGAYMGRLAHFDLGYSQVQGQPVFDLVTERVPATLLLMITALAISLAVGMLLGMGAAMAHRSWADTTLSIVSLLVYATPQFWLGLMLIVLFSVKLDLLPSGGIMTIGPDMTLPKRIVDVAWHLILPAVTLALFYVAIYTRLMRGTMLEVLKLEYITTARAKGVSERRIGMWHAARNALLPVVTLAGVQVGHALGGSILIETVFGWPGLGRLVFDALKQRDLPVLLGILFISSFTVVLINLLVDLVYGLLDPRIVHR